MHWRADVDGRVDSLAIEGHTLHVAGTFTSIDGRPRRNLAAIDLRTGRVTSWRPNRDGVVRALGPAVLSRIAA